PAGGSADWGTVARVQAHRSPACQNSKSTRELPMSSTFDTIANIIAETCDIPRDTIKPESHAINDLGIDSLDFLDIAFAIDKAFGIKIRLEKGRQESNNAKRPPSKIFKLTTCAPPSTNFSLPRAPNALACASSTFSLSTASSISILPSKPSGPRRGSRPHRPSSKGTFPAIR